MFRKATVVLTTALIVLRSHLKHPHVALLTHLHSDNRTVRNPIYPIHMYLYVSINPSFHFMFFHLTPLLE